MPRVLMQRDAELAALDRQLASVRAGNGRLIIVEGPAGIGKSSLLVAAAAMSGLRVLRAAGGPLEHDAGWGIARQLFEPVRAGAGGPARRALEAGDAEPALAGDAMHAAAHGLIRLACSLSDQEPTLLVVDDVHWADAPSLRWLIQLTRRLGDRPLAVLGAVRAGEPPSEPAMLADLLAAAPEPPVRPRPLGPEAVAAMVGERLPAARPGFALACHAVTAGNPFLLRALLGHLVAEGIEPTAEVGARLSTFGPVQVARVIDRLLARLPAGAGDLARAFAVLGRAAPLRQAAALADRPDSVALTDQLCKAGLLQPDQGTYALVHPLVAAALHEALPPGERARWHGRAAALLAVERADPEVVALHLLRSEPARDPATIATLRAAAGRAARRGAPENAVAFLRRALAEPPADPGDEAEVRAQLGLLLAALARPQAPELLAEAVELAADPARRARIALAGGRALGLAAYFDEALSLCRRGLDRPAGVAPDTRAQLEAELVGNALMFAGQVAEARDRVAHATGKAMRVNRAWVAISDAGPAAGARALLRGEVDDDSLLGTMDTLGLIVCGDLDAARARCDALIDVARPRGWLIALAHAGFLRALAGVPAGRLAEAEEDARMTYDFKLANDSPPSAVRWAILALADVLIERDAPDEAEEVLGRAVLTRGELATPMLLERRARLRLAQHRPAEAHDDLVAAAEDWRRLGIKHPGLAAWRVDDCQALAELGDLATARKRADEHGALAAGVGLPGPRGAGLRAAARARPAEAIPRLTEAVETLDRTPARLELVRALVDLGAALRRASQRAAARAPLTRALDLAEQGGMRLLATRARAELVATGARPRRSAASGVDALTPAERRVAVLAAGGCGNREIAQQLFVSRRTVETHLTHTFQKLGVTTRTELAVVMGAAAT